MYLTKSYKHFRNIKTNLIFKMTHFLHIIVHNKLPTLTNTVIVATDNKLDLNILMKEVLMYQDFIEDKNHYYCKYYDENIFLGFSCFIEFIKSR